jgi:hypothetical protein
MDAGDEACAGDIKVTFKGKVTAPKANVERYHTVADCGGGTSFQWTLDFDVSDNCKGLTPED